MYGEVNLPGTSGDCAGFLAALITAPFLTREWVKGQESDCESSCFSTFSIAIVACVLCRNIRISGVDYKNVLHEYLLTELAGVYICFLTDGIGFYCLAFAG